VASPKCPICGGYDEKDNFQCPNCGREHICGKHYDVDYLICSDCAKAMKEEGDEEPVAVVGEKPPEVDRTAEGKTPFYYKKIKCPVCGVPAEQRRFKLKIYAEKRPDLDKHPTAFAFTDKDFNRYHPPLYYFWHCYNCRFTESYLDYENPAKPVWSNFNTLKEVWRERTEIDQVADKLINWLGKGINYDQMNYPIAFKLHLLSIYVQEVMDEEERDTLKCGRFYLRTAWILRELKE